MLGNRQRAVKAGGDASEDPVEKERISARYDERKSLAEVEKKSRSQKRVEREFGVRLEDSQTRGKGCRGQAKARGDTAELCAVDRPGLLLSLGQDLLFLSTTGSEKCSSSETAQCCLLIQTKLSAFCSK